MIARAPGSERGKPQKRLSDRKCKLQYLVRENRTQNEAAMRTLVDAASSVTPRLAYISTRAPLVARSLADSRLAPAALVTTARDMMTRPLPFLSKKYSENTQVTSSRNTMFRNTLLLSGFLGHPALVFIYELFQVESHRRRHAPDNPAQRTVLQNYQIYN